MGLFKGGRVGAEQERERGSERMEEKEGRRITSRTNWMARHGDPHDDPNHCQREAQLKLGSKRERFSWFCVGWSSLSLSVKALGAKRSVDKMNWEEECAC